ncbi:MAG TPA: MG2 domain-containing protein, partial [Spirochaetia bacterium]|nr:MG2 domain-containing protein [Spirochaetia bacterium]
TLSYSPRPEELDVPQPDYNQAHLFYQKALELEIGPTLREEVRFQMARMREKEGRYGDAVSEYRSYLQEFDEDWGKIEAGREGKPPAFVGLHRGESRYRLAESLIKTSQLDEARRELENLLHLLSEAASAKSMSPSLQVSSRTSATNQDDLGEPEAIRTWHRLVLRRIPYTYAFPNPPTQYALESGLASITEFLRLYPDDSIAVTLAWYSVTALNTYGRTDDTIRAARDFISRKGFRVLPEEPPQEAERRREVGIDMNPAEQFDFYQKKAHFLIGALLLAQRDYPSAIEAYTEYIQKFPNGPDWTNAQRGIINAEYGRGIDLVVARKYDEAMDIWNVFLVKYPLDSRSRQILFTMGQIDYQRGKESKARGQWQEAKDWFQKAIAGFRRLVAKYPGTEESGLAQLRIGEILENELGDLKGALEAYRFLTWSSSSGIASARAQTMSEKELVVRTERIYRTNEPAVLALQMRNVQSVTVKSYRLNLKDYFLKFHSIRGVENLDLPLISPDKTWEVPIKGYSDYLPIQQSIEIPMEGPGVYAANIAEPDLEATTLLIRSDIDLIVKSSKTELLVFVQNMRTNQPVQNAKVMVTDGTKLLLEGDTGSDGVLYRRMEELKGVETLCVLAEKNGDIASNNLSLAGLGFSKGLAPKGYIYTDRPVYRPGETVFLRGIVREVEEGAFSVPENRTMECAVVDARGRTIFSRAVSLSRFGTFEEAVRLGSGAAQGEYSVRLTQEKPKRAFAGSFTVEEYKLEKIRLNLDFDREVYFRGETIKATFSASYYYGNPVAGKEVRYWLPDNRTFTGTTDDEGKLQVSFDTTPLRAGAQLQFRGLLTAENVRVRRDAVLASQGFYAAISLPRTVSLAGESIEVTVRTTDPMGNPVARTAELTVLRRQRQDPDPLLAGIPWIERENTAAWAEKTAQTYRISTAGDGLARVSFTPDTGGQYVYRLRAKDRFGNAVAAEATSEVSGGEDAVKIRLLALRQHYRVGEKASVRLHSRLENPSLALVTFDG